MKEDSMSSYYGDAELDSWDGKPENDPYFARVQEDTDPTPAPLERIAAALEAIAASLDAIQRNGIPVERVP